LREALGLTYLFIGHSLPVIEFVCDRVAVMERGRIVKTLDAHAPHGSTLRLLDTMLPVRAESRRACCGKWCAQVSAERVH
jgi:peptide/nickel transport system ATP-binding protein